jgi:hypothetical protein
MVEDEEFLCNPLDLVYNICVTEISPPTRSWLAISSFSISLFTLCTLPLPLIPSSLLGILGFVLGGIALWRIQRYGGTNRDRLFAIGGVIMGIVPIISFCITTILLAREIPRWAALLSAKVSQVMDYLSSEIPRWMALLSNLFR